MRWVERYVGLPFVEGGRIWPRLDCWGLVVNVMREVGGIELPQLEWLNVSSLHAIRREVAASSKSWVEVPIAAAELLDVLVIKSFGLPIHVGIVVKPGYVLHTEEATGCVCVPFKDHSLVGRLEKAYRHAARTDHAS